MICRSCKKEFFDEFAFCPYCGKKKESGRPIKMPPNTTCLCAFEDEKLLQFIKGLQNLTADEIRKKLTEPAEVFYVYKVGKGKKDAMMHVKKTPFAAYMSNLIGKEVFLKQSDAENEAKRINTGIMLGATKENWDFIVKQKRRNKPVFKGIENYGLTLEETAEALGLDQEYLLERLLSDELTFIDKYKACDMIANYGCKKLANSEAANNG